MSQFVPRRSAVFLAAVVVTVGALTAPAAASAAPADDWSFYQPPSPLPDGQDGDVIRSEPARFYSAPLIPLPASAQRIMYLSRDALGRRIAVTGAVLTPNTPWPGPGERPIVSYAIGTHGLADRCAPSRNLSTGTEFEAAFMTKLLTLGYAVALTDYQGLGTPGTHTYVNRLAEAHAVLDVVRAAQRLPVANLPDDGPVAIVGYSQGGGAAGAATELAPDYAPDLDVVGGYAGAPPADLAVVADRMEGSYTVGFVVYAAAGLAAAYPELDIPAFLNDRGRRLLAQVQNECAAETIALHAFTRTADLTVDGRSLGDHAREGRIAARVAEQTVGRHRPAAPVMVTNSVTDEGIPFERTRQLARDWCDLGATVNFQPLAAPGHGGGFFESFGRMLPWLDDRVAGRPAPNNCGSF
ncbi:lipase family protein [Amycolatopsis suaedae]|nr:lipase family protein [Amycolatopsis suaedae]